MILYCMILGLFSFFGTVRTEGQYKLPKWVVFTSGQDVPPKTVIGGVEADGEPLYVARAMLDGGFTTGKLRVSTGKCMVPWGGLEHAYDNCEVLTNPDDADLAWVEAEDDILPTGVLQGGDGRGYPIYVGRVQISDKVTVPGKVAPHHKKFYAPYDGKEKEFTTFEALVIKSVRLINSS